MQNSKNRLKNYFYSRFGVHRGFWKDFQTHERGNSIWITSGKIDLMEKFVACGLRALRITNMGVKPTTYVLQFLDEEIKKNVVILSEEELKTLISKRERIETDLPRGYLALKYEGIIIGCGLKDSKGLRSQIPKGLSKELQEIF